MWKKLGIFILTLSIFATSTGIETVLAKVDGVHNVHLVWWGRPSDPEAPKTYSPVMTWSTIANIGSLLKNPTYAYNNHVIFAGPAAKDYGASNDGTGRNTCVSPENTKYDIGPGNNPAIVIDPIFYIFFSKYKQEGSQLALAKMEIFSRSTILRNTNNPAFVQNFLSDSMYSEYMGYFNKYHSDNNHSSALTFAIIQTSKPEHNAAPISYGSADYKPRQGPQKGILKPIKEPVKSSTGHTLYLYDAQLASGFPNGKGDNYKNGLLQPSTKPSLTGYTLPPAVISLWVTDATLGGSDTYIGFEHAETKDANYSKWAQEVGLKPGSSQFFLSLPASKVPAASKVVMVSQKLNTEITSFSDNTTLILYEATGVHQDTLTSMTLAYHKFEIEVGPSTNSAHWDFFQDCCVPNDIKKEPPLAIYPDAKTNSQITSQINVNASTPASGKTANKENNAYKRVGTKIIQWNSAADMPATPQAGDFDKFPGGKGVELNTINYLSGTPDQNTGIYPSKYDPTKGPVAVYFNWQADKTDCQEDKDCKKQDCDTSGCSAKQGTPALTDLRWYNLPLAFAEIKEGLGYQQFTETTQGKLSWNRSGEQFEVMMGIPETEKLYINGGGSEGQMDVKFQWAEVKHTFKVAWSESYSCPGHHDGCCHGCDPSSCSPWYHFQGTVNYDRCFTHEFKFLHFVEGDYRTPDSMLVTNPNLLKDGSINIPISTAVASSHTLSPNPAGLEVGPATDTGTNKYNHGATKQWTVSTSFSYSITCSYPGPLKESQAISDGNNQIGDIFAQNDDLIIKIGGTDYRYTDRNIKKTKPYGNTEPLHAAPGPEFFYPAEGVTWDTHNKVPLFGYLGEPQIDGEARNSAGSCGNNKPFVKEDVAMIERLVNGIYPFEQFETQNYLSYGTKKTIKGMEDLQPNTSKQADSYLKDAAKDVYDESHYLVDGDKVKLQYTAWQFFHSSAHWGHKPDGAPDEATTDNPHYRSVNPVVVHNPTTAIFSRISDIPQETLQDQRIKTVASQADGLIIQHPNVNSSLAPARQYVDFDYKIYMPNQGTFNDYWTDRGNTSGNYDPGKAGIEDVDECVGGTRGKGYDGPMQTQIKERNYLMPYDQGSAWDVRKWINAKYVQFPYDVYYYGMNEPGVSQDSSKSYGGGDSPGFYEAGTWIMLYNKGYQVNNAANYNEETFNFHIESHQKDLTEGNVLWVVENINARDVEGAPALPTANNRAAIQARADWLYGTEAEWYINGYRNRKYGKSSPTLSAAHAAKQQVIVDEIGRIGNSIIEDSADPAWSAVYWRVDGANNPVTTQPVSQDIGVWFNWYESKQKNSGSGAATPYQHFYNRFGTLAHWHDEAMTLVPNVPYTLPQMYNPLNQKSLQTQKLGYENQGSVQTIGDYDRDTATMWVYPKYRPVGNFKTGNPLTDPYFLYASDPFDPSGTMKYYYDSEVPFGRVYNPQYKYYLNHTLVDTRGKIGDVERNTPSYQQAKSSGSNQTYGVGTPSWIEIPQTLRTYFGSQFTYGRTGKDVFYWEMNQSHKPNEAWVNAQKWNFRFSLPKTTSLIFKQNTSKAIFEGRERDQYLFTEFVYRTDAKNGLWDLTTFTDTAADSNYWPEPDNERGVDPNFEVKVPSPSTNHKASYPKSWIKPPRGVGGKTSGKHPTGGSYEDPQTPMIIVDYSNPATSDKTTIGTH